MDPDRRGSTTTPPLGQSTVYSQTQCSGVIQYKYHRKYTDWMLDICGVVEEKYGAGEEQRTTAQTQRWQHSKKPNQNKFKKKNTAHAYMCRKVKLNHYRLSCHFAHLSMGQKTERNKADGGGGGTYILHLSVEECAWGQLKRLYHNLGHCLRRRAHSALVLMIRDRQHTQQAEDLFLSHTNTHTPAHTLILPELCKRFSTLGIWVSLRRTAQFWINVRRKSFN